MSHSCSRFYVGRPLKKTQEVACQVNEAPRSLVPFEPHLCQLSTYGYGHAAKDILYACPDRRLHTIQFLGCVAKRMIASVFFVDQTFEATETQKITKELTGLRLVCPYIVMFVFWFQQEWEHLAVVNIGRSDSILADESMVNIDANAVLVAVVTDPILCCPASI